MLIAGIDWDLADKIYAREEDKILENTGKKKQEIARDCTQRGIIGTTPWLSEMHRAHIDMLDRLAEASIDADWKVVIKDGEEISDAIMDRAIDRLSARLSEHTRNFMQSVAASIENNNIDQLILVSFKAKNRKAEANLLAKSRRELEIRRRLLPNDKQEIQNMAQELLRRLYEVVGGDRSRNASVLQIGRDLGYDRSLSRKIADYLAGEELIARQTHDGIVRITQDGISDIEGTLFRKYRLAEEYDNTSQMSHPHRCLPKVFISYKWEGDAHNKWVEKLATDLRNAGIEAVLDKWDVRLGESFTEYMTSQINEADVVLFIMTTASVAAVEAPRGKGGAVKFEMQMATARRTAGENVRLIGIYREGDKTVAHLRDHRYADFRDDLEYSERLRELIDDLLERSARPPLRGIEKNGRRYQVPNVERKKEEAKKGKLTEVEQGSGPLDGEEGSPHPDMVTLENYESSVGGNFRIMANKQLDRATGDAHGLFFRIIHNAGESWSCVTKISGSLYTMLGKKDSNIGSHYEALTQLGLLRIREAIEKSEPFSEFIFTGYDFPTDQEQYDLLAKLKEVRQEKSYLGH